MVAERRPVRERIDGLLIVDKPAGWTSHDVIGRLRRLTGIKRIGHAGTLDPLATGVLPVGIGQGTRVLEYITEQEKVYEACVRLGITTDTYDADGTVVATSDCEGVTEARVREALAGFLGEIEQRPPAYSAIKVGGVALHRLARAGVDVQAPVRRVTIHAIDAIIYQPPLLSFTVRCSKGTYIRGLAHDLGVRLGCGAHLTALRRTRTGGFTIEQAVSLEQWQSALDDGSWPAQVLPLDAPLMGFPAVILDSAAAMRLTDGVPPAAAEVPADMLVRAYDGSGYLLALMQATDQRGWRAGKVFVGPPAPDEHEE